ncbi:hypothetical protein EYC84_000814 [Monilinia fructicola]|uniref:Uncharacterized protein n=1 Tax=Monilinia fructicola TaxID=38448 RepID=A0A5M9JI63_MONFR|nr:hypothetical protein EYC84_000814 [Monilinia fructicola]
MVVISMDNARFSSSVTVAIGVFSWGIKKKLFVSSRMELRQRVTEYHTSSAWIYTEIVRMIPSVPIRRIILADAKADRAWKDWHVLKTVNHVLDSPSSDEFSSHGDRTPFEESKIKVETDDTLGASSTVKNSE